MASTLFRANGIVLSWRDYREADRWYSAFTREHGKVTFRARGANKPLAKLTPHLETVAESEFLLVDGRYYHTIAGVERRRAFPSIYQDLLRRILAKNSLHLVDIGTQAQQADEDVYHLLRGWLLFLETCPTPSSTRAGFLLGSFTLKLMHLVGYRPELYRCLGCKDGIAAGQYRWHALEGGVVCRPCATRDERRWFSARNMSDEALKLLRFAEKNDFHDQLKPHLPGRTVQEFHDAIESLIVSHFPTIPANSLRVACALW